MTMVRNRRSLTPASGVPSGPHQLRRGGARREVSERVHLVGANLKTRDGWALNISRGGIRVILEERVELGEEYQLTVGSEEDSPLTRPARVVWVQEEPDGFIVGLEFQFLSGEHAAFFGSEGPPGVPGPDDSSSQMLPVAGDSSSQLLEVEPDEDPEPHT